MRGDIAFLGVQYHSANELGHRTISQYKLNDLFIICTGIWVTFHKKYENQLVELLVHQFLALQNGGLENIQALK